MRRGWLASFLVLLERIRQETPTKMTATSNSPATTAIVMISEIVNSWPVWKIRWDECYCHFKVEDKTTQRIKILCRVNGYRKNCWFWNLVSSSPKFGNLSLYFGTFVEENLQLKVFNFKISKISVFLLIDKRKWHGLMSNWWHHRCLNRKLILNLAGNIASLMLELTSNFQFCYFQNEK